MKLRAKLCAAVFALVGAGGANAATYTFQHVTLIDGTGRAPRPDMSVTVTDGRFVSIEPSAITGPPRGKVIEARGKYLIPGLMDIHIHLQGFSRGGKAFTTATRPPPIGEWTVDRKLGEEALGSFLYSGVTTVLDVGNIPQNILPLRADERAGKLLAPHIFATGQLVTYPGSHGTDIAVNVSTWPEAKALLEAQVESQHPDVQKITYDDEGWGARPLIPILPKDLLQHIIEFYNDHGVRTTVHISNESRAREAIYSGVDSLAHTPVQGPLTEEFVKLAAAKQIPMASTMTIGDNYSRVHDHPEYLDQPLYVATMTAAERARLKKIAAEGGETALKSSPALYQRTWRKWMQTQGPILQDNLRRVDAAGGVVAAGTDTSNGASLQRELELLSEAGIPNLEVIKIATFNGARLLGKQEQMGSVEDGKIADAVLLNADPVADINNTKNIALVMKAGEIIDESKLPLAGGPQKRRWPAS
ncbi:amidohydrolase family protein [Caulobacter sp. S45]|uniref:amidohydrolase family protein n=1 Tax=Caulobacter sp. S45 TaxID=1641861 RepID=UPI00131D21AF|nr:amidohydrolase family protein [Caulobacter sp. S45]